MIGALAGAMLDRSVSQKYGLSQPFTMVVGGRFEATSLTGPEHAR